MRRNWRATHPEIGRQLRERMSKILAIVGADGSRSLRTTQQSGR